MAEWEVGDLDRSNVEEAKRLIEVYGLDMYSLVFQEWAGRIPNVHTMMGLSEYEEYVKAIDRGKDREGRVSDYSEADYVYRSKVIVGGGENEFLKSRVLCAAYNEIMQDKARTGTFFRVMGMEELLSMAGTGRLVCKIGVNYEPDDVVSKSFTWNNDHFFMGPEGIMVEFKNSPRIDIRPLVSHPYPRFDKTMKNGMSVVPDAMAQLEGRIDVGKNRSVPDVVGITFGEAAVEDPNAIKCVQRAFPRAIFKFRGGRP